MTIEPSGGPPVPGLHADPLELATELPLSEDEAAYVEAARAPNTLRGYRSDWAEFTAWCTRLPRDPLPAAADTISAYLTELARAGAKVGTMSRRLSSIRFAHQLHDLPDPTTGARVVAVWEGIRRTHGAPPDQAAPLMPPALFDVLDHCPQTKVWKTRPPEPDLAGLRDRALLLVGFFAALRRSELANLRVEEISAHDRGLVLTLPRSKTNQRGEEHELVVLPRAGRRAHCPVTAVQTWLDAAGIADGPVFRKISRGNRVLDRALHPESINDLVQAAVARAGLPGGPFSAHSLRAGFVTYAHLRGASDRAIAHQTRHRSLATLGAYVRLETAWQDNAATQLGL
ncbi:site-specific integrase [Pseudonocardia sp. T1-2H]|uniref:site-specific integrase n=1 Tax=Pseudonocardia sp. T1-2H TaxID=3128899 RepID=UPI0031011063